MMKAPLFVLICMLCLVNVVGFRVPFTRMAQRSMNRVCSRLPAIAPDQEETAGTESAPLKPIILLGDNIVHLGSEKYGYMLWNDTETLTVNVFSRRQIARINAWNDTADVRWLSELGSYIPETLAPMLNITAFPVLTGKPHKPWDVRLRNPQQKITLAARLAEEVGPNRLIIWLDIYLKDLLPMHEEDREAADWRFTDDYKFENSSDQKASREYIRANKELFPYHDWHLTEDGRHEQGNEIGEYIRSHKRLFPNYGIPGKDVMLRPNTVYISPYFGLTEKQLDWVDFLLKNPHVVNNQSIYQLDMQMSHYTHTLKERRRSYRFPFPKDTEKPQEDQGAEEQEQGQEQEQEQGEEQEQEAADQEQEDEPMV